MMRNKIFIFLILGIFLLTIVSADLGTYKQADNIFVRGQLTATSVNITIYYPNSTIAINNQEMSNLHGDIWNYSFSNTIPLGIYIYDYCDQNGNNCIQNIFTITPSGNSGTDNLVFFIFVILLLYVITFVGFYMKNEIITTLGGMAMMFLGIYIIKNGIIIFRDTLTNYIAYITIALGAIMGLWKLLEWIEESL